MIFTDEFNLFVHGRLAQCIKDIHHWNMLREIYLYRVGELNERTSSLEHVERDLFVQGR